MEDKINIIIVGAGEAGSLISKNILEDKNSPFSLIGFVDDDKTKKRTSINGKKVLGGIDDLADLVEEKSIDELLIAMPSGRGDVIRKVIDATKNLRVRYKIIPRSTKVLIQDFGESYLKHIRDVSVEDLLGGQIVKSELSVIETFLKGQSVLITGAAGSIGSELARQVIGFGNTKKVILFDWSENGMFMLQNDIKENYPDSDVEYVIGDIKDKRRLEYVFKTFSPNLVFHAAAYKHVPLMEANECEAVKNNVFGTKNVAEMAIKHVVSKFVLISSDKAVNPTNIMGATKRAAEKVVNVLGDVQGGTIFCSVRFGNVINSNGSVIPFFRKQIQSGGPVTVTHKEINRFFMTIPEAVNLILRACVMGERNDLFVLDMGVPVKIYDIAEYLICLEGYIPGKDIKIHITGLRPGEKIYEEVLVNEEEVNSTVNKKIFKTKNYSGYNKVEFLYGLSKLTSALDGRDSSGMIRDLMKEVVETYEESLNNVT